MITYFTGYWAISFFLTCIFFLYTHLNLIDFILSSGMGNLSSIRGEVVMIISSKDIFEISFKYFIRYNPKNCEEWHVVPLVMEDLRAPKEKIRSNEDCVHCFLVSSLIVSILLPSHTSSPSLCAFCGSN